MSTVYLAGVLICLLDRRPRPGPTRQPTRESFAGGKGIC